MDEIKLPVTQRLTLFCLKVAMIAGVVAMPRPVAVAGEEDEKDWSCQVQYLCQKDRSCTGGSGALSGCTVNCYDSSNPPKKIGWADCWTPDP